MNNAFKITNLKKTYKDKFSGRDIPALKGIDLEIKEGSFSALLGPNGAGKSTIINIIAGLVNKTSGEVVVNGHDLDDDPMGVRRSIGVVPQEVVIDPFFTVRETLEFYAGYFGVTKKQRRTDEILTALNLADKAGVNPRRLSGGMKRRLLVAKALVHNPKIIILDEPTAGVDVDLRIQLWDYVRDLNGKGSTILLTTHYLEEAEELCDKISIINHGKVIANDNTKNLIRKLGKKDINFTFAKKLAKLPKSFEKYDSSISEDGVGLKISYDCNKQSISDILSDIGKIKNEITDISTEETDLEDVFRELVKKKSK